MRARTLVVARIVVLFAALGGLLGACAAVRPAGDAGSPSDADVRLAYAPLQGDESAGGGGAESGGAGGGPTRSTGAARVGEYALAVPKNIVWVPWKILGGGIKGVSDGVQAGFAKGRMPLFGTLFIPVNVVVGLATGMVEGAVMPPGLVGPDDNFGRAMSLPTKRNTSIWWYP